MYFILYSLFFSAISGAILGWIYRNVIPEFLLLPTWVFVGILSCFITLAVSFVFTLVFDSYIKTNFTQSVAINVVISDLLLIWSLYKSITNK